MNFVHAVEQLVAKIADHFVLIDFEQLVYDDFDAVIDRYFYCVNRAFAMHRLYSQADFGRNVPATDPTHCSVEEVDSYDLVKVVF